MAGTAKLFSDKSDLYAKARPTYPKALFEFIAELTDKHEHAWDCATGNGQAALGLAPHFQHIHATDISKQQIANHLDVPRADFSVSSAERTHFADKSFDLVNVAQALHWFDFDLFWSEVARVLKPGGAFVTYSYDWFVLTPAIDAIIETSIKAVIAPYWAAQNQLAIDGYKDVDFPFSKLPVPELTIAVEWNFDQLINYLHTWSATRRCMDSQGDGFFEHAKLQIKRAWGDPKTVRLAKAHLTIVAGYPNQS